MFKRWKWKKKNFFFGWFSRQVATGKYGPYAYSFSGGLIGRYLLCLLLDGSASFSIWRYLSYLNVNFSAFAPLAVHERERPQRGVLFQSIYHFAVLSSKYCKIDLEKKSCFGWCKNTDWKDVFLQKFPKSFYKELSINSLEGSVILCRFHRSLQRMAYKYYKPSYHTQRPPSPES